MNIDENGKRLIDLMASQEEKLSELYSAYSFVFADNEFWKELSIDENIHKQWVLSLYNSKDDISIEQDQSRIESIHLLIGYMEKLRKEIKDHSLVETLQLALNIEKMLIEKNCFTVFKSDSESVQRILAQLLKATLEHVVEVEGELTKVKFGQIKK